jgi:hypothetical protein
MSGKQSTLNFDTEIIRIKKKLGCGEWVDVYSHIEGSDFSEDVFCALIPKEKTLEALNDPSWDFQIGDGLPGFVTRYSSGKPITEYYRYSSDSTQPLVILRRFYGIKKNYWEISEEFRHYFNLYDDKNGKFIEIDDNGDEIEVAKIDDNHIVIKLNYIREFLAATEMALLIQYEFDKGSSKTLEEQNIAEVSSTIKETNYCYTFHISNYDDLIGKDRSCARLYGVKVIDAFPTVKPRGLFTGDKKYEEFFIRFDEQGKGVYHTCEEKKLSNDFGKNPTAPNYLTPVFFSKDVLTKYYSQPSKYSVHDGSITCGGLWSLRVDNNHSDYVVVFLGDLGMLEHKEQLHWKHHNLETKEKISHTCWTRKFEAQFADPERSDLFFKYRYLQVQTNWRAKIGWDLFQALSEEDQYHFKTLRIPLTNEQKEFDEQVLSLTKLLIDSLNEKKLTKGLPSLEPNSKGIAKLEAFLKNKGFNFSQMNKFLRDLQELRSCGVAHLKGSQYDRMKKAFGIGEKELSEVFDKILFDAIRVLNTIDFFVLKTKKEIYGLKNS